MLSTTSEPLMDSPLEYSSGKTSPESSAAKTTLSAAFLQGLPEKIVRWSRQGGVNQNEASQSQESGRTLVVCLDPKEQSRGGSLMPNISEWPNDAVACSLSRVLEKGSIPQRYFLSPKACAGILRRAENRGKTLPEPLLHALMAVAFPEAMKSVADMCSPSFQASMQAMDDCKDVQGKTSITDTVTS